jgi:hypothetical protein
MTTDLPMPVVVTRHQCPHCRRYTRASRPRVEQHMAVCWRNPAARACKTCKHFEPATSDGPYPEHPGWPEECGAGKGIELEQPITNCKYWEQR